MTWISIISSAVLLIAAVYFAASRDFGDFVIATFLLPALLLLSLLCIGIAAWFDRRSRNVKIAAAILLLTPVAAFASFKLHDDVRFALWSATHMRVLAEAKKTNAVIAAWDSWGMAGSGNDAYLISDISDDSRTVASANQWRKRMHLACPIVATQRMAAKIYMVTTYNCPL